MKRFIIKSIVLILLSAFVVILVTPIMILKSDDYSRNSHEINVALAYHRLDSLKDTNKIVIIAGSNGEFSMNSQIMSDSLHMPVVNTCTHAGIGVRMQFEMYKDLLQKGDIVVFCPEYGSDKGRLYGDETLFRIISTHNPNAYLKMSPAQWIYAIKYAGIHFNEAMTDMWSRPAEGPYSSMSVNKYGDISFPREHQEIGSWPVSGKMDVDLVNYYKYVHRFCRGKGIQLIYLPPTLIFSMYKSNRKQIDSLAHFVAINKIPYQAKPSRYTFPDSLYFDTPYHMTSKGADIRTYRVVEDLKRILCK